MSDFLFNSSFNYQKITLEGSTPIGSSGITVTLASGLTGTPDFRVFYETGGVRRLWGVQSSEVAYIDGTSLKAYVPSGTSSGTLHWRIYAESS